MRELGNVLSADQKKQELKCLVPLSYRWEIIGQRDEPLRLMHHDFRLMPGVTQVERF